MEIMPAPPLADRSSSKYRTLVDSIDEGFCVIEVLFDDAGQPFDYRFLETNAVFEEQSGLVAPLGRTARELVPGLESRWFEIYGRVARTGEPIRFVEGSDAMGRWFDVYAFRWGSAEARQVALLFSDITARRRAEAERERLDGERRAAEEQLRESEQRFRSMADTAPAVLWVTEPDGSCSFLSRSWYECTGQREEEALGFGWLEAVHADDRPGAAAAFQVANARRDPFAIDYRLRQAAGDYRWVIDAGRPRVGPGGEFLGFIGTIVDIHDRRQAEEQLRQAAKMEAIGRLAGGIAHDFNNQLHALAGFAGFVARDPGLGARSRRDLEEIRKATERMAGLTRQLLAFSRQQVLQPETLQLNAAVLDASALLQRLIGADVEMSLELTAEPTWIQVDPAQLLQVLMNLAINARDAMPEGGRLRIRTALRDYAVGVPSPGVGHIPPGSYVMLTVTDAGVGIAPHDLPHIFEPFFTTKEVGKGTGLGLATVHGIVSQSRGHVWAESRPDEGAEFTILLPSVEVPDASHAGRPAVDQAAHPARLVVVDDEDMVRAVVSRTLEEHGYEVLQARNGHEALERLAESRGTVDLILTDVVMPVLGGRDLGERLAREHPGVRVIWMSGYPRDSAFGAGEPVGSQAFLQKPIPEDVLLRTVQDILARP